MVIRNNGTEYGQLTNKIKTIQRKRDQKIYNNYKGISLLNTASKIMATQIQRRLTKAIKDIVEQLT